MGAEVAESRAAAEGAALRVAELQEQVEGANKICISSVCTFVTIHCQDPLCV